MLKNSKNNIDNDFEPIAIQQKDIIKLIEHTKGKTISLAIALGGLMGLRNGEIRGLTWNDIDFKNKKLHVRKQLLRRSIENTTMEKLKTKASADELELSSYVISLLENEKQKQQEASKIYGSDKFSLNFVFAHTTNPQYIGKPFAHNYYNENLSKALRAVNMSNMRFHDLRYSYGSNLLYQGVAIQSVSKLMRHANPQITLEVYAKVIEDLHKEATAQIEEKLNADLALIRSQMTNN